MSLHPYRPLNNRKNSSSYIMPDLGYKHLKAIVTFQQIYRNKKKIIHHLNTNLDIIYNTMVSVTNNINNNYINGVIDSEHYRTYMEKANKLIDTYCNIQQPINIRLLHTLPDIGYLISWLHYNVTELVKLCGASRCYDILRLFGGDCWDLGMAERHRNFLRLFNTMFIPVLVKTSTVNINEIKVLKSMCYTESLTLKIHGAEIILPLLGKSFTIRGYFREDPLNIARIRGTLADKLNEFKELATNKHGEDEVILNRYIDQISLRDFLSLDITPLVNLVGNDLKELHKLKLNPKGHVLEDFLRAPLKRQYHILTLLLLDEDTYDYAQSIITTLRSQNETTLNKLYGILHWSLQKTFDTLVKTDIKEIGVDESVLPYETRINNMKCDDVTRKKAKDKLKEIKSSKDGNDKATRYLDGLLRIPFGIVRKEKIIKFMDTFRELIVEFKFIVSDYLRNQSSEDNNLDNIQNLKNVLESTNYHSETDIDKLIIMMQTLDTNLESFNTITIIIENLCNEWSKFKCDRKTYLNDVNNTLHDCIYGQDKAKRNIESIIAQWINGEMSGVIFGFQGYPGTGKTTLAKQGIAKCLIDEEGNPRPFYFTSLGGANGASFLLGHGYTYVGSQQGKLAEYVQDAKIMNPILYFDELDKVSGTPHGDEIIRVLTHLLDPEQNDHIEDRYFGVSMDLSKALIILSYNDSSVIDNILMDRIHEINFKQYNPKDKTIIAKKYILPRILKSHGFFDDNLQISDELLRYIIETYTCEAGVRDMKDKLTDVIREINLRKIYNETEYQLPYIVKQDLVDDILGAKNKIHIKEIPTKSQIGWVNGLYATSIGTGGITIIEVHDTPSDQKYHLQLTGKLGDVMKESVICAKTNSWTMFKNTSEYKRINDEWRENALHVHFPAAGTSKDGPSAGAAITTAIVSYFSKKPFRNYIAMTGEIDLHGNVCAIGGLQCKIEGAHRAGVKLVLIPRRNEEEYNEFKDIYGIRVVAVDNVSQVIRTCLLNVDDDTFNYPHTVKDDPVVNTILQYIHEIEAENIKTLKH
uniref:Lon proteolytic domain-containing protein n=1 Tax=viral metagenome TaxID=1070528 RepID=A0A6C0J4Y4_9ZZZZ